MECDFRNAYGYAFISDGHGQSHGSITVVEQVSGDCVLLRVFSDGKQNQALSLLSLDSSIIFRRFCRRVEPPFFYRRISTGSTDTTYTVTGLDKGATYLFGIRAVNRVGKSFALNRIFITLPVVPVMERAQFRNPLSRELVIQREAGTASTNPRSRGPSQ